jgi:hypothetical protein
MGNWKYCMVFIPVLIITVAIRWRCVDVAGTLDGRVQHCSTGVEVELM